MYYSYVEIEYVATRFSPARTDLALKLLMLIMPSFHNHTDPKLPILGQLCQCNSVRVHPYAYPQHMKVLKHFPYSNMDVGSSQRWSTASTMSSCHHFIVATLIQITNIWANFARCNSERVNPHAYPQHMNVLEHFSHIKYECGKQSVVVYSLNNAIMPSFHSSHAGPKSPLPGRHPQV